MDMMKRSIVAVFAAFAAMVCDAGVSGPFALDSRDGARIANETEAICYSPDWNGSASCTVDTGDTQFTAYEEGSFDWIRPIAPGLYTLSHTAGDEILTAQFAVLGDSVTITNYTTQIVNILGAIPEGACEGTNIVYFSAMNGTSSVELAAYAVGEAYGVLPDAVREGYVFAGWFTGMEGGERVTARSIVEAGVDTLFARWVEPSASLYAQWGANAYSVSFDANGGVGTMESQNFVYDSAQQLFANAFTKTGYTFLGWSTSAEGPVVYRDLESVENLTAEAGWTVALFAAWEKMPDMDEYDAEDWVVDILAPKYAKAGERESDYRRRFREMFGNDYLEAMSKETGKIAPDGTRLRVWHDYVAGTDPTDSDSQFSATIDIAGGRAVVTHSPELSPEEEALRSYRIWGKADLSDESWTELDDVSGYRFFKVTVELK